MFLVPSLHLGTGLLAASLALFRVWLQPSSSSRWQRLRDQRPIQQGRDHLPRAPDADCCPSLPTAVQGGPVEGPRVSGQGQPAQPMGSNTRQVSGRCWVMGVTPVLCLNPLIGPAYWRGPFFTEDKRGTQNPPSGHFMPIHFTVPADTHISQIPTQRSHLSVSLPKGARRTAQGLRNSQRSYQVTREVSRSADKGLKSHKPTVFRIYR